MAYIPSLSCWKRSSYTETMTEGTTVRQPSTRRRHRRHLRFAQHRLHSRPTECDRKHSIQNDSLENEQQSASQRDRRKRALLSRHQGVSTCLHRRTTPSTAASADTKQARSYMVMPCTSCRCPVSGIIASTARTHSFNKTRRQEQAQDDPPNCMRRPFSGDPIHSLLSKGNTAYT